MAFFDTFLILDLRLLANFQIRSINFGTANFAKYTNLFWLPTLRWLFGPLFFSPTSPPSSQFSLIAQYCSVPSVILPYVTPRIILFRPPNRYWYILPIPNPGKHKSRLFSKLNDSWLGEDQFRIGPIGAHQNTKLGKILLIGFWDTGA